MRGNMKDKPAPKKCQICDATVKTNTKKPGENTCAGCRRLLAAAKNNPEILTRFLSVASGEEKSPQSAIDLPDVLDAKRYRTTDREKNTWYVSVSELQGSPVEIFASTAFDKDQHLQSRISNLTTITRLISLILRHIFMDESLTLEKTLIQLRRSSRRKDDLPYMLSRVLANYSKTPPPEEDDSATKGA